MTDSKTCGQTREVALELDGLREEFVGYRVLVDGKGIPTCPYCNRHLACYSVSVFHYVREKSQRLQCPALNLVCPDCLRHTSTLPIFPSLAGRVSSLPLDACDAARLHEHGFVSIPYR
ncbi:MAG: hypothetical protein KatS3mg023_3918 [Armatimonadota bacterium]|nr:MAG: hypothetical protein KatS3mg023_3918 [Armatimonadota bacterium]